MPYFSAGQLYIGSGILGSETIVPLGRVTNINVNYNIPRTNVNVLNRGKPLEQRSVVNYTPVEFSCDSYFSSNSTERCLGLVNSTGIAAQITNTTTAATYGVRNMQVLFAPITSSSFNGGRDLKSGVITSYALKGGVSEPVTRSLALQFLDMSGYALNTARNDTNVVAGIVKPEGAFLTGIQFTGFGVTGVNIQSFSVSVNFNHASVMQLGQRFPVERPLTDVTATLQVQGYLDGFNNALTGLGQFNCGYPVYGTVGLTLYPACSTDAPTTITMRNPYLDNETITPQAGNFATVAYSFSLPLGPNPLETGDGSVLTIT